MERIVSIAARLQGTTATSQPSPRQPQNLEQVSALMAQLKANYPSQQISSATAKIWMAQWLTFASEHGLDVLRRALFLCMSKSKFLPQPADVAKAIKEVMAKKIAEERKAQPIGDCSACDNQRHIVAERIVDAHEANISPRMRLSGGVAPGETNARCASLAYDAKAAAARASA